MGKERIWGKMSFGYGFPSPSFTGSVLNESHSNAPG